MKLVQAGMFAIFIASSASLLAQTLAQSGPRRDGNWDVTMEMQMPDMPNMPKGMSMPPMKTTQCITREDAADPQKSVPTLGQRGGPPSDCKISDYKVVGNKTT